MFNLILTCTCAMPQPGFGYQQQLVPGMRPGGGPGPNFFMPMVQQQQQRPGGGRRPGGIQHPQQQNPMMQQQVLLFSLFSCNNAALLAPLSLNS